VKGGGTSININIPVIDDEVFVVTEEVEDFGRSC
jgi:hypothetical protein